MVYLCVYICIRENYFPAAVLSEEYLAIVLKNTPNHFGLGQQLGMDDDLLEALFSHFKNNPQLLVNHMIGIWLMEDPEDAAKQLSEALIAVGDRDTATKLQLLTHLGENSVQTVYSPIISFYLEFYMHNYDTK